MTEAKGKRMRGGRRPATGPGRRGAVLAITMVLAFVLLLLSTTIFFLFNMNVDSYEYTAGRIRAQAAAEAGANIALYYLAQGTCAPQDPLPFSMDGDSAQWMELPGGGKAWVVVDPFDGNSIPNIVGGVEIRSRGLSGGVTRDVVIRAAPDYASRYALLVNDRIPTGVLADNCLFDGPVHCNGMVEFSSSTPDSTDDPYVSAVSTSSEYFYFSGSGYSEEPHPEGSTVWVRPYAHHLQGSPYWEVSADSVDFPDHEAWFRQLQNEAASQGSVIYLAERVLLNGNMVLSRMTEDGPVDTLFLAGRDVVFVQGGAGAIHFKSIAPPSDAVTFVFNGPVSISGSVFGPPASSVGPLGIVTLGDIIIAADPRAQGEEDWPSPWDIQTSSNIQVHGVLAAPRGTLRAEDPGAPSPGTRFTVYGGLMVNRLGMTGIAGSGYEMTVAWEPDLTSMHPPHFPALDRWSVSSWQQDPDYEGLDIDDNMF